MTITDVTIKPWIGNRTEDVNDVMPGSDGLNVLKFEKRSQLRFEARGR